MRLYEILKESPTVLYHGSRQELDVGTILTPRSDGYVHQDDTRYTEEVMDMYRPGTSLPRDESVYMTSSIEDIDYAGGYDDYVYIVEPIGKVERNNLHWYSQVAMYAEHNDDMDDEIAEWATNYWSGASSTDALWEFRAPSARIVKMVLGDDD